MKLFIALLLLGHQHITFAAESAGQWVQVGRDIDGENAKDYAGGTKKGLAMNGDGTTIVVGASGHDGDSGGENSGHIRVFDFDGESWLQRGLDIEGEFPGDYSGSSVVLSNDGMVVGVGEPNSEAGNTGRFDRDYGQVRVFEWIVDKWIQRGEAITGDTKCDFASRGGGLAMDSSGTTIVMGSASHNVNGFDGRNQGQVRVFDWDGKNWIQRGGDLFGEAPGDWFGNSVAINGSGNTLAVGANFNDGSAEDGPFSCNLCRGSVRIFDWRSGEWMQRGNDIDGEQDYDFSGSSVVLNNIGDVVVIGSPQTNAPLSHPRRGAVTVYEWKQGKWQKRGSRIEGESDDDISGESVAISSIGNTIAIGAYLNEGSSDTEGHVRIYDWNGISWLQRGNDIDGENKYDYSGYSIDISADGNKVASGARFTDDGAGYFAGHVRVFSWNEDECYDYNNLIEKKNLCDDKEDTNSDGFEVCFSSENNVQTVSKGLTSMEDLQIGDFVHVGEGKFSRIYSFGHRSTDSKAEFIQLYVESRKNPLEISKDHMIFVRENRAVPAFSVSVGDQLILSDENNKSRNTKVTKISKIERVGAYAPFTESGTIVVNDLLTSNYVSLQEEVSGRFTVAGVPILSMQWLAHASQVPHRFFCHLSSHACSSESYTKGGISHWVLMPLHISRWILRQHVIVTSLLSIPVICLAFILNATESLFLFPITYAVMLSVAITLYCLCRTKYLKQKS